MNHRGSSRASAVHREATLTSPWSEKVLIKKEIPAPKLACSSSTDMDELKAFDLQTRVRLEEERWDFQSQLLSMVVVASWSGAGSLLVNW